MAAGPDGSRSLLLIRGARILALDPGQPDLESGDILIRDGAIEAIGTGLDVPGAVVVEADRMIAMPGFVDTHWHLWNALLRGVVSDDPTVAYMVQKGRYGPLFSPNDTYRSVRLALAEGVDGGVTTVHDWAHNVRHSGDAEPDLRALVEFGVRARFAYGAPSTAQGLTLEQMAPAMAPIFPVDRVMDLADIEHVASAVAAAPAGLLTMGVNLRGPARSTQEVYRAEWAAARSRGLPIAMHCAGTAREVRLIHQARILAADGLLGPDVLLAHCNYLEADEIAAVVDHGVTVSISPLGELRGGATMAPVTALQAAGVTVGLSCDTTTMTSADMFATMRLTVDTENSRQADGTALSPRRALEMATIEGARALGLDHVTGSLRTGKRADLILIRADDVNLAPMGQLEAALVHGGQPRNVDTVIIDGRIRKAHGQLVDVDVAGIVRDAQSALDELRQRVRSLNATA